MINEKNLIEIRKLSVTEIEKDKLNNWEDYISKN